MTALQGAHNQTSRPSVLTLKNETGTNQTFHPQIIFMWYIQVELFSIWLFSKSTIWWKNHNKTS